MNFNAAKIPRRRARCAGAGERWERKRHKDAAGPAGASCKALAASAVTICGGCGKPIPETIPDEAFCVACRYRASFSAPTPQVNSEGVPIASVSEKSLEQAALQLHADAANAPLDFFETLMESGQLDLHQASFANRVHEQFLTKKSFAQSMAGVREILDRLADTRLGKTPEYLALIAFFNPTRTLEEIGLPSKTSKQAIFYHREKIRKLLTPDP